MTGKEKLDSLIDNERYEESNPINYKIKGDCFILVSNRKNKQLIYRNGKEVSVKRYIYEKVINPNLNDDYFVKTSCKNTECINPDHLYSIHLNKIVSGKYGSIPDKVIKEIFESELHYKDISVKYNISLRMVYAIKQRKHYSKITKDLLKPKIVRCGRKRIYNSYQDYVEAYRKNFGNKNYYKNNIKSKAKKVFPKEFNENDFIAT